MEGNEQLAVIIPMLQGRRRRASSRNSSEAPRRARRSPWPMCSVT